MFDDAVTEKWATYLVEGYRPGSPVEALKWAAERLRAAAEEMSREGKPVRYLRSTIVPTDESCLFLVEAASEDLVREAHARAGVRFERISTAISVEPQPTGTAADDARSTRAKLDHARPNERSQA
jgi:hypothetical protein